MPLPPERAQTLAILRGVAAEGGWRCVLIGGSVPEVIASRGAQTRATFDADAIVSTATWEEFESLKRALEGRGFRRGAPYQMFSPDGVEINLIPFGEGVVEGPHILWPGGGRMSALGLAEALETAIPTEIDDQFQIDVIPEPTFVLLKLIAYQDRPEERRRDVADVIACCERSEIDSNRRYEASGVAVDDVPVSFDDAGALVLGLDVTSIAHADSRDAAGRFFESVRSPDATPVSHAVMEEGRSFLGEERREQVFRLLRVLRAGMLSSVTP